MTNQRKSPPAEQKRYQNSSFKNIKVYKQFGVELMSAHALLEDKKFTLIWWHLERAHILGQASAWRHFCVHWLMLYFAIARLDFREVLGQLPRLLLAIPTSLLGLIPVGNTGRANVGMFKAMRVPRDFEKLLQSPST